MVLNSNGQSFPVYVEEPISEIIGGLIVIHEVWGLTDHIKDVARRFASEGYVVLAPDLLGEIGMPPELIKSLQSDLFDPELRNEAQPKLRKLMSPLSTPEFSTRTRVRVKRCFDYLADMDKVDMKVGVVGFCFGGTYSFSLAVDELRLKAAVPFYGHADFNVSQLKNIHCPIQAFYGGQDTRLIEGLDDLTKNMQTAGVDFSAKVYPNCGHAFFNDTNRFSYNVAAAQDAWKLTNAFLKRNLNC
jgi:carboxymethylenebutenolidase